MAKYDCLFSEINADFGKYNTFTLQTALFLL